ncbi:hypothetical protein [Pedobacter sp. Leaf170]|uniref:hypothetical protein n=1 Tax=Pedobacter sp. Leaf170 TaxID=2876558 RepID=UPI001E3723D1|nr:hypothetical protein [Pedobacter sp. Leaf170]
MAFKKEIIVALKAENKAKGLRLSNTRIETIATVLDEEVVEETDIDGAIKTFDKYNPLAEIAKTDDKLRTLSTKKDGEKTQAEIDAEKAEAERKAKAEELPDDVPPYIKAILDGQKLLTDKLAAFEGTKVVSDRKAIASEKFKDANDAFKADLLADLEEITFKDDDHFNSYLERKEKTFGDLKQAEVIENLSDGKVRQGVITAADAKKQATKEELDTVMSNLKV